MNSQYSKLVSVFSAQLNTNKENNGKLKSKNVNINLSFTYVEMGINIRQYVYCYKIFTKGSRQFYKTIVIDEFLLKKGENKFVVIKHIQLN